MLFSFDFLEYLEQQLKNEYFENFALHKHTKPL